MPSCMHRMNKDRKYCSFAQLSFVSQEFTMVVVVGLSLTSRFALISHIRSHTGEKPFTCSRPGLYDRFCPHGLTLLRSSLLFIVQNATNPSRVLMLLPNTCDSNTICPLLPQGVDQIARLESDEPRLDLTVQRRLFTAQCATADHRHQ